jgi:hypothetical protein
MDGSGCGLLYITLTEIVWNYWDKPRKDINKNSRSPYKDLKHQAQSLFLLSTLRVVTILSFEKLMNYQNIRRNIPEDSALCCREDFRSKRRYSRFALQRPGSTWQEGGTTLMHCFSTVAGDAGMKC